MRSPRCSAPSTKGSHAPTYVDHTHAVHTLASHACTLATWVHSDHTATTTATTPSPAKPAPVAIAAEFLVMCHIGMEPDSQGSLSLWILCQLAGIRRGHAIRSYRPVFCFTISRKIVTGRRTHTATKLSPWPKFRYIVRLNGYGRWNQQRYWRERSINEGYHWHGEGRITGSATTAKLVNGSKKK